MVFGRCRHADRSFRCHGDTRVRGRWLMLLIQGVAGRPIDAEPDGAPVESVTVCATVADGPGRIGQCR